MCVSRRLEPRLPTAEGDVEQCVPPLPFTTTVALTRTVALSVTYMLFLQPQSEQSVFMKLSSDLSKDFSHKDPHPLSLENCFIIFQTCFHSKPIIFYVV